MRYDRVDDASGVRGRGGHRLSVGADGQRHWHAAQARQALCAARSGNDADVDLGLTNLRIRGRDADVAGYRQLEPAAERRAVDGGDDGFGGVFDLAQARVHSARSFERLRACLQRPEDVDVRADHERPTRADKHDGGRGRICDAARDRARNRVERARGERVDGRVVNRDDSDGVANGVVNHVRSSIERMAESL